MTRIAAAPASSLGAVAVVRGGAQDNNVVIPSRARNLHFRIKCRSLASLGMTWLGILRRCERVIESFERRSDVFLRMRRGNEPCLERRRSEINPAIERGVKEPREQLRVRLFCLG